MSENMWSPKFIPTRTEWKQRTWYGRMRLLSNFTMLLVTGPILLAMVAVLAVSFYSIKALLWILIQVDKRWPDVYQDE